jgi:glycosyltransferase involved in cell wall biosynthesis
MANGHMRPTVPGQIRIVRIITRLNVGGPAQHVTYLAERMHDAEFSTALIAGSLSRGEGDMAPLAARRGVGVTYVSALGNERGFLDDLRALLHLYRLIRRERPTIVHLHLFKARLFGGIAARVAGVPLVIETLHGHLLSGYYGPIKTGLIAAIERFVGRWIADAVVVLSESQRQELLRRGIGTSEKIHVVPLGLELGRFLSTPRRLGSLRRELAVSDDTLLIGAVGRLVPVKGYTLLLEAMRHVAATVAPPLAVIVVGDGPSRRSLEAEAHRLQIRHMVRFLGWRNDVEHVFSDLDMFVQPSLNEGTPVSLIEAMAAGTPAIATRVGGIPDVVDGEHTGLLVPPGDSLALAQAILRLGRDPHLRRRIGEAGRRAVFPRYDIAELVARLRTLYAQLLVNRSALTGRSLAVKDNPIHP